MLAAALRSVRLARFGAALQFRVLIENPANLGAGQIGIDQHMLAAALEKEPALPQPPDGKFAQPTFDAYIREEGIVFLNCFDHFR